jgi:two-component system response regulator (stage 0 sporulation protein F)
MTKILIVDDQAYVRELLSEELISEGYRVAMAGDVESLRGHLRFSKPDLVLLDLYLDGPDGIGVLHDIKGQNPNLPVIIFTAYDSYVDDPRPSQADGYVIKSIDLDELKGKIADALRRKPSPQEEVEAKTHFPQFSAAHGF